MASMASNSWRNPKPLNGPVSLFEAFGFNKGSISFPQLQAQLPGLIDSQKQQQQKSQQTGPGGNAPPGNASANEKLGFKMVSAAGWGSQWTAFNNIVMAESSWDVTATNPTSGAYGIPQALPGSKMASAGANWRTSAATQIKWMIGYIRSTYGNPNNAWAFHKANGWY
jgi:hypothetical protein